MKFISTLSSITIIVISLNPFKSFSQCTASITGDTCITSSLTAHFSGNANSVRWYRDGVLQQIRGKRNPNSTVVAGGGATLPAQLFGPHDVTIDKNGNIYVVDNGRQRVQKWAPGATEGITVAGGNGKGSNLNQLFTPQGIAVDKNGNVYITDDVLDRVTRWAPGATTGVLVAGGNGEGSAANQLAGPQNIHVDNAGNLYIADRWNHRVQKWAPGATAGTTVAGGNGAGSAANQLYEPLDVVTDLTGNVYVIDYYNNRVQKWAPGATTGVTVAGGNGAGTAASQFNFTTALSITNNGTLYIRDQGNYRIQQWKPGAVTGITVAGGNGTGGSTQNKVNSGFGLCVDENQNVYVPELFENTVKKFARSNTADMKLITNIPGSYKVKVNEPNGCAATSAIFNVFGIPVKPERIIGPKYVEASQKSIIYKVDKKKGETYQWTVPPDATIVGGQGQASILVNWGTSSDYVSVIAINPCGVARVKRKLIYVTTPVSAAVENSAVNAHSLQLKVYPNPAINTASIIFSASQATSYTMNVTDLTGKTLITKKGFIKSGQNKIDIAVDQLNSGIYFINIKDNRSGYRQISFVKGR